MTDRLTMQKQMLASHTKILERYIRDGAHDKVAEWQPKVDKLRQQIDEMEGRSPSMDQQQPMNNPYGNYNQGPSHNMPPQGPTHNMPPNQPPSHQPGPSHQIPPQQNQLPFQQQGYASPQPTQQNHDSATAKRAFEILNENNVKLTQDLATKDTIIEGKSIEIDKLSKNVKGLSDQLAGIKASTSEKASGLEREIQLLKNELEEGKVTKAKELENQKGAMQSQIDQINRLIEERDNKAGALSATLTQIKTDQENESVNLGIFISKSVNAMAMANETSKNSGNTSTLVVELQQDVGFANLTIKSAINGDIANHLRV